MTEQNVDSDAVYITTNINFLNNQYSLYFSIKHVNIPTTPMGMKKTEIFGFPIQVASRIKFTFFSKKKNKIEKLNPEL